MLAGEAPETTLPTPDQGRVNVAEAIAMIEPDIPGTGGYGIGSISEENRRAVSNPQPRCCRK